MIVRQVIKREVDVKGLGEALKQAQLSSNQSIADVLRAVGISRTYWHKLIKEDTSISFDLLKQFEQVLGWDAGVKWDDYRETNCHDSSKNQVQVS